MNEMNDDGRELFEKFRKLDAEVVEEGDGEWFYPEGWRAALWAIYEWGDQGNFRLALGGTEFPPSYETLLRRLAEYKAEQDFPTWEEDPPYNWGDKG